MGGDLTVTLTVLPLLGTLFTFNPLASNYRGTPILYVGESRLISVVLTFRICWFWLNCKLVLIDADVGVLCALCVCLCLCLWVWVCVSVSANQIRTLHVENAWQSFGLRSSPKVMGQTIHHCDLSCR
jgi:hypothetical protein